MTEHHELLAARHSRLALESPRRGRDVVLCADAILATFFLVLSLPVMLLVSLVILLTSGPPILYRGERGGRADCSMRLYARTLAATAWQVLRQSLRASVRPTE